jgi:hypothetical protein
MATFLAGQKLRASSLENIIAPGWTDYSGTFALTATTTNPTLGNSTVVARYRRSTGADVMDVQIGIIIGSTFSAGSGSYRWSLPFAVQSFDLISCHGTITESGTALRVGGTHVNNSTTFYAWYDGPLVQIGSAGLSTAWTTGDEMNFTLRCSVA